MTYINNLYDNTVAGVIAVEQADEHILKGIEGLYDSLHEQKIERDDKEDRQKLAALIRSMRKSKRQTEISDKVAT